MEPLNNPPQILMKGLKFIHWSFLIGCIVFTAIIYFLNMQNGGIMAADKNLCQVLWYISVILLGAIPLSYYLYKRKVGSVNPESGFDTKLVIFKSAFLTRLIILDAACYMTIAIFLMTNIQYVLYQAIIIMIILSLNFPNRTTIADDLNLTQEETDKL